MALNVQWVKSTGDTWLPFESFNIADVKTFGVYVIWHDGNPGRVVYVGQGDIKARLCAHRSYSEITRYRTHGTLRVTWAAIPAAQVDGVECYLANTLGPLVGDAHPNVAPIAVNW